MLKSLTSDLFTGPDGKTWAIGRIFAIPVLIVGLAAVLHASFLQPPQSMTELSVGLMGTSMAVITLIKPLNSVDTPK